MIGAMMGEEDTRTIRRLTTENAALKDANHALAEKLARYERESPHVQPPTELNDELLAMAYEELAREREQHNEAVKAMSQSWQEAFDEVDRKWQKAFDDARDKQVLHNHHLKGMYISSLICFVILTYAVAVVCTYAGAEKGLEAALIGRSLSFSLVLPTPVIVVLLAVIAWRVWHWCHPPASNNQNN